MNESFSVLTYPGSLADPCPPCVKYPSEGYAEWYEEAPISAVALPPITPAIPEPSVLALLLPGLALAAALSRRLASRSLKRRIKP